MKANDSHSCAGIRVACGAEMAMNATARIELTISLERTDPLRGPAGGMSGGL